MGDARDLPFANNTIDGIITSPPYSIASDYIANDTHALRELDFDLSKLKESIIGVRGAGASHLQLYYQDIVISLKEMYRVIKPNKYAVIVINNATFLGNEINTVDFIIENARKIGFLL